MQELRNELDRCKRALKEKQIALRGAHDKIFDLQPIQGKPLEPRVDYLKLSDAIEELINEFLDPILDDKSCFQDTCKAVNDSPDLFIPFRSLMTAGEISATAYQDADCSIIVALVMRFIQEEIFETSIHGIPRDAVDFLEGIVKIIETLDPKRTRTAISAWRSEAYHALVVMEIVKKRKDDRTFQLTNQLALILRVFTNYQSQAEFDLFVAKIRSKVIEPAFRLNEGFVLDENPWWMNSGTCFQNNTNQHSLIAKCFDNLEIRNALASFRKVTRANLESGQDITDQLKRHLRFICTKIPGVLTSDLRNGNHEEEIVIKPVIVVAWSKGINIDPNEKREPGLLASLVECTKMERNMNDSTKPTEGQKTKYSKEIQKLTDKYRAKSLEDLVMMLDKGLTGALDKISELRPYRQAIIGDTAKREYVAICDKIEDWILGNLDPILDDESCFQAVCSAVQQDPSQFQPFRNLMTAADLDAMTFEDIDVHIVIAIIMRFVQNKVWAETSFCIPPDNIRFLEEVENGMKSLRPKREFSTIRAWRNETECAFMATELARAYKVQRTTELVFELANILKVFALPRLLTEALPGQYDQFVASIRSSIIDPAIELQEKIATTDDVRYSFRDNDWIENSPNPSASLVKNIDDLECANILEGGRKFRRVNLGTGPSVKYLCTTTPAFICQRIQRNTYLEAELLAKPKIIVAWSKESIDPSGKVPRLLFSLTNIVDHLPQ